MPMPLSSTLTESVAVVLHAHGRESCRSAAVYLAAFVSRFDKDLREPQRIGIHLQLVRDFDDELVPPLVDERARGFHRRADDRLQIGAAACAAAACRA